jgi:hypothetical protein
MKAIHSIRRERRRESRCLGGPPKEEAYRRQTSQRFCTRSHELNNRFGPGHVPASGRCRILDFMWISSGNRALARRR